MHQHDRLGLRFQCCDGLCRNCLLYTSVAIYLVTHTFDIVMAVFDIGQNVVSGAAGVIHGNTSIDIDSTIAQMRTGMENMGVGELLGLSLIHICFPRQ